MRHSVIMKVGDNLVYQCSQHEKPTIESSTSPVEFNRALPEWEHTSKSYMVKKEDMVAFKEFMDKDGINVGIKVPHEDIEVYDDGFKKYARYNKGEGNAETATINKPNVEKTPRYPEVNTPMVEQPKKEHKFYFKVEIDDDNGEPMVTITNDAPTESMDFKLLKSFIIKGMKNGINLTQGSDGEFEINLGNKN